MLARLVELKVLRDPDDDVIIDSEEESSELEGDFDFIHEGKKRVGKLMKNKRYKHQKEKPLIDMMPQNDFLVVNKMLEKSIDHEKHI